MSTCSTDTLAKYLDLTPQRCNQLAKEGVIVKEEHGKFHTLKSIRGYIQYLRKKQEFSIDGLGLDEIKIKKLKAETETLELKLSIARGKVVDVEFAEHLINSMFESVNVKLSMLPNAIIPLMLGVTDYAQAEKILLEQINAFRRSITDAPIAEKLSAMGIDSKVAAELDALSSRSKTRPSSMDRTEPDFDE